MRLLDLGIIAASGQIGTDGYVLDADETGRIAVAPFNEYIFTQDTAPNTGFPNHNIFKYSKNGFQQFAKADGYIVSPQVDDSNNLWLRGAGDNFYKLDLDGNVLAAKDFDDNDLYVKRLAVDSAGNIYVAIDLAPLIGGNYQGYLVKMNSSFVIQWTKEINSSEDNDVKTEILSLFIDPDDDIYLGISFVSNPDRELLLKFDGDGTLLASTAFDGPFDGIGNNPVFFGGYLYLKLDGDWYKINPSTLAIISGKSSIIDLTTDGSYLYALTSIGIRRMDADFVVNDALGVTGWTTASSGSTGGSSIAVLGSNLIFSRGQQIIVTPKTMDSYGSVIIGGTTITLSNQSNIQPSDESLTTEAPLVTITDASGLSLRDIGDPLTNSGVTFEKGVIS